jgi:16S rRNA (uracil1498-N3)-methyltransferase
MEIKATNFYVKPSAVSGELLFLDEAESYHLAKVMRAKPGDIFYAIDGVGKKYKASLELVSLKKCQAKILSTAFNENEPLCAVTLACGLCRSTKLDFIIEKGTEIGISKFCFFISENTLADKIKQSSIEKKLSRWQNLALSAAKQSLRTVVPAIIPPTEYADIPKLAADYDLSLIADLKAQAIPLPDLLTPKPKSLLLLVGPEAGLTDHEVQLAVQSGFKTVSLGPRRLRAETAAIAFSAMAMSQLGEI